MKKINYYFLFLVLLVCLGCSDESDHEDEVVNNLVKDEPVVDIEPENKITWDKDGKEMVLISNGSF